ncbi:MAG: PAS domain-containing protein [Clostridia bacterium]|nr:PAS domain-containing protein [Clostridia bacterium]
MFKSLYLRRTILLVLLSVLLCAVLTAGLYSVVSRYVFAEMKTGELEEVSESVSIQVARYMVRPRTTEEYAFMQDLITGFAGAFGTNILVYDYNGQLPFTAIDETVTGPLADLMAALQNDLSGILSGNPGGRVEPPDFGRFVVLGTPVVVNNYILGAVFLVTPMREMTAALSGLLRTLLLSSLASAFLMVLPAYYFSKRLLNPLHEMKNVATALSNGNFEIRANRRYRGEFSELATAFNNLADNLSDSIAALSLERTRLRQVIDGITEGIVAVDSQGRVTHVNPAVRRMFGAGAQDRLERPSVIPDPGIWTDFDQAMAGNVARSWDIPYADRTIRVSVTPLVDEDGTAAGAVGLFRDVTESQRLEQTRRDYVANVSHEMRTPLTAMRALVEPLSDGMVTAEGDRQRYYGMILSEVTRLTRLINDMLELSRLQAGTVSMSKTDESLRDLLDEVADKYAGVAEEAGIRFLPAFADQPDIPVRINRDRIVQILVILLDNAVKYTPDGGAITLDCGRMDGRAFVRVSDTGIGISPEDLPHVFERFYKADKSRRPTSGTGLGLSIAREILDALGERITVESAPGEGTAFTFTLALSAEETESV